MVKRLELQSCKNLGGLKSWKLLITTVKVNQKSMQTQGRDMGRKDMDDLDVIKPGMWEASQQSNLQGNKRSCRRAEVGMKTGIFRGKKNYSPG